MTRIITIQVEVPDGVDVTITGAVPSHPAAELMPLRSNGHTVDAWAEHPTNSIPEQGACSRHGLVWKVVPAGISRKTGRAYGEFRCCPAPGCEERPR